MVKHFLLLSCWLPLACNRGYDDVPPSIETPDDGGGYGVAPIDPYHDPSNFRGNDQLGEPFPLTTCDSKQIIVGLSVVSNAEQLPIGMTLHCATLDVEGKLSASTISARLGASDSADSQVHVIDCPSGFVAVSLRGGEFNGEGEQPYISSVGIECAEVKGWLRGLVFPTFTAQVGASPVGTRNFADGCARQYGILKGFSGRLSDRIEQLSVACAFAGYL
jgi:hypothetical protein